ncbi:MAG: fumarylacetoacetate hydrolase family protein [Verrucomicrobiales bacterium]|nr:fumarylacetoacetate hydrolase family protein [Verrucomicrobiales bacterium]
MFLFRTRSGIFLRESDSWWSLPSSDWDDLFNAADLTAQLQRAQQAAPVAAPDAGDLLAPIGTQEVWAAGVTYYRSRTARMEESKDAGGGSFYDRVYEAERPEIFFKATPQRTVGPGGLMHLRRDSRWMVPEPEFTLAINAAGQIIGCTVGNDLSCRDIEGENPLYLPQAKCFKNCAALGPALWITPIPLAADTAIECRIEREGNEVFHGETTLAQLKRKPTELAEFLYRDNTFPTGAYLMTGTGIVPPDDFTLHPGDLIHITLAGLGTLSNSVA